MFLKYSTAIVLRAFLKVNEAKFIPITNIIFVIYINVSSL